MLISAMVSRERKMALAALTGRPAYAWRRPGSEIVKELDFNRMRHLAQVAEKGKFDIFFLADGLSVRNDRMGLEGAKGFSGLTPVCATLVTFRVASVRSFIMAVARQ